MIGEGRETNRGDEWMGWWWWRSVEVVALVVGGGISGVDEFVVRGGSDGRAEGIRVIKGWLW